MPDPITLQLIPRTWALLTAYTAYMNQVAASLVEPGQTPNTGPIDEWANAALMCYLDEWQERMRQHATTTRTN
jgi:hypothetical protein